MNSVLLINYFEKQSKVSGRIQELMAQAAQLLLRKDELCNVEKALTQETLIVTMYVYELEGILTQLKLQYQQQCTTKERISILCKYFAAFFAQVTNFNFNEQLYCKMELTQLKLQNDVRELNEEFEMDQKRKRELEQRPIVQIALAVQREAANMQTQINNAKQVKSAHRTKLLDQLKQLRYVRNGVIVFLVQGRKQIVELEKELKTAKISNDDKLKTLLAQKQDLLSKLQKLNAKLPDSATVDTVEQQNLPEIVIAPPTTKLVPLPNLENVNNANVSEKPPKRLNLLESFMVWETKRQSQFQQIFNTTAEVEELTGLETNHVSSTNLSPSLANGLPKSIPPRSILRRPSAEDDEEGVPKKRVRFAETQVDAGKNASASEPSSNIIKGVKSGGDEGGRTNGINDTYVIEENNDRSFNNDTETIEIFSTAEMEANVNVPTDGLAKQQLKRPIYINKANKLLKKARLVGTQKNKAPNVMTKNKENIEIQECRIVKPAGTKLPTKLPIELSPEHSPINHPPTNRKTSANALQPTTKENQVFATPNTLPKRKITKMPDCDTFFREFLNGQSDSPADSDLGSDTATKAKDPFAAPQKGGEEFQIKRKKTEMDFDSYFRESLEESNDNGSAVNDQSCEMQGTTQDGGGDDLLQFDTKFGGIEGFFGGSVDDYFAGQTNSENPNDDEGSDLLSFDYGGKGKETSDDFL